MIKSKKIIDKIDKNNQIRNELINKHVKKLDKKIKEDKYQIDNMILQSSIGYKYHDLIDSKDMINSKFNSEINKTYHSIDVELYKLNKKIDNESRHINIRYNKNKEKLLNEFKF